MPKSDYVYESGEAIDVGNHGDHDYVYSSGEPVADTGISSYVFESGTGLRGGQTGGKDGDMIWANTSGGDGGGGSDTVYELATSDKSVVQSTSSPSTTPDGAGGDANVFWHDDYQDPPGMWELAPSDLSVVRKGPDLGGSKPTGSGGYVDAIWGIQGGGGGIMEISTSDLSVVRSNGTSQSGGGAGGTGNAIWAAGNDGNAYEYDPSDLSVVRSPSVTFSGSGYGGDDEVNWNTNTGTDVCHEVTTSDFSVLSTFNIGAEPQGIGGTKG